MANPIRVTINESNAGVKTPPVLVPKMVLGLNTSIKGNVQFLSDEELIFPAGAVLAFNNSTQKKQVYIKLPEKGANINLMALSPNKKHLAICDVGDKVSVTLYDPVTHKKRKQIFMPIERDIISKRIEAVAFSCDSKSLIFVVGEPDWLMLVYKLDKLKLDTICRANNSNNTGTIIQICPNPVDPNQLVLIGAALFRILCCTEGVWRQFGFNKTENLSIASACWLSQDRILAGTTHGKLMFFENGELRRVFHVADSTIIVLKDSTEAKDSNLFGSVSGVPQEEITGISTTASAINCDKTEISHLMNMTRGFIFGFQRGCVHFFEKLSGHKYVRKLILRLPEIDMIHMEDEISDDQLEFVQLYYDEINSIAIPPSENRIVVTCSETQIYTGKLVATEGEVTMSVFGLPMHHGPIGTIAVCNWKPIFMSAGCFDRMLRVWNYDHETVELEKKYEEDILSCDLHPTGFFAAVSFTDKLRVLKITINDFVCDREYPLRGVQLVKYSKLGHLFAAAHGNNILVYSSVNFEHMFNLKGHDGQITAISWSHDDYKISTCGTEGAVYEWQISTTRRIGETLIRGCHFSGLTLTNDGKSNFAVAHDGKVREIVNSNVCNELKITGSPLHCMALANSDAMMFAAGNNGTAYTMLIPLQDSWINEYTIHNRDISSMQITYDDSRLITASPSCICIWKIVGALTRMVRLDKEFSPSTDVMIKRSEFMEKLEQIKDLQMQMAEKQTQHAHQMRLTIGEHTSILNALRERCQQSISELKEQNEDLELEHSSQLKNIDNEIAKLKLDHNAYVKNLEASYVEKLIVEYNKFMLLEEKLSSMRIAYDRDLENLAEAKRVSEEAISNTYEVKLQNKSDQIENLQNKVAAMANEAETSKLQIEEDADREIYEIKTEFEKDLRAEQELNVRLRSEAQTSRKLLQTSQKNIDDLKQMLQAHEQEEHKLKTIIFGLEKTRCDLKNEISERDMTIEEKELRITELKNNNQELEKLKFILDFKINELNDLIGPRDRTIQEQADQIRDMFTELDNLQKIIQNLELQMTKLREKLRAVTNETKREAVKNCAAKANIKHIRTDIHKAAQISNNGLKLQKAVCNMYHTHNDEKDVFVTYAEDAEARRETMRQRDYLERTVKDLRVKVSKSKSYTSDNLKLVDQNAQLVAETNNLRKSLKVERKDNRRMTALFGANANMMRTGKPALVLEKAIAANDEIRQKYIDIIEENEEGLNVLREENNRLRDRITEILNTYVPKPLP